MAVSSFTPAAKNNSTEVEVGMAPAAAETKGKVEELASTASQAVQDIASDVSHRAQDWASNVANKAQETASATVDKTNDGIAAVGRLPRYTAQAGAAPHSTVLVTDLAMNHALRGSYAP